MGHKFTSALVDISLVSLVAGTAYAVSMVFPFTLGAGIVALSNTIGGKFLASSVLVSLELLGIGMAKRSDRLALSAILMLVIGVLVGYFVL